MQVYNICIEGGNEVNISVKGLNTDTYLIPKILSLNSNTIIGITYNIRP